MRIRALPILYVLLAALLAGCASMPKSATGPVFTPASAPADKALVYFYRPYAFELAARPVFMAVPKEANNCYSMLNSGYLPYVAAPGRLTVVGSVSGETIDYSLSLAAGETRYVAVRPKSQGFSPVASFEEAPAGGPAPDLSKYRLIDPCKK